MTQNEFQEFVIDKLNLLETGQGALRGEVETLGQDVRELQTGQGALRGEAETLGRDLHELQTGQGALRGELETLGRDLRRLQTELPAQVVAGVVAGIERTTYATDLRILQSEMAHLRADVDESKHAAGQ